MKLSFVHGNERNAPSNIDRIRMFDLPKSSGQRMMKQLQERRKQLKQIRLIVIGVLYFQAMSLGVNYLLQKRKIWKWVLNHHLVIHSPVAKDKLKVLDPANKNDSVRKSKLLLQCSVRELHRDLHQPPEVLVWGDWQTLCIQYSFVFYFPHK